MTIMKNQHTLLVRILYTVHDMHVHDTMETESIMMHRRRPRPARDDSLTCDDRAEPRTMVYLEIALHSFDVWMTSRNASRRMTTLQMLMAVRGELGPRKVE